MNIEPSFDTWTSIFLVVALHGIVLGTLFFYRKKGRNISNRLLGFFLLLFSLNLISNVLYWTRFNLDFPHLMGIASTFHFLYGPVLFFYVVSILKPGRSWKIWDAAHLVPFLIFLIWMLPFYLQQASQNIALVMEYLNQSTATGLSTRAITVASIKMLVITGNTIAISFMLRDSRKRGGTKPNNLSEETFGWIRIVSWAFWGYVISFVTYYVLVETINFQVEYDYMISFAMSLFIFGIGYLGLFKPSYLEEAHNGRYKYESSSLDADQAKAYLEKLLAFMVEEKPYLNGDLKMVELADQLSIPSHHLSQIINERLEKNFFEFVNSYRVDEAKKILADPAKKDFKILRVAFESGFNNKTTFNSAFKDEVGTTPSRFRKRQLNGK
jgi:AraC-like DNA-binding protein